LTPIRKAIICGLLFLGTTAPALAQTFSPGDVWTDTKLYFTAPLRWDAEDWLYFGGALGAVAAAHQFDGNVRRHFANPTQPLDGKDPNSIRDAAPAAIAVVGTWVFSELAEAPGGRIEAYSMLEAAALSSVTAEVFKFAAGRRRPSETTRVDDWRASGSSFPSLHATAAFAIGTVLAESGSDDFRWTRRLLGFGLATGTAYLRLHDNQHWLSDVVAGAAIGTATGAFVLQRRLDKVRNMEFSVTPAQGGGIMVGFNAVLN